jgi:hypothetical protein
MCKDRPIVERPCNAKVPNLDVILGVKEEVESLDVPVDDLLLVDVAEAEERLNEVAPDKVLWQALCPFCLVLLDELGEAAFGGELHNDIEDVLVLVNEAIIVLDDVRVIQLSENTSLVNSLFPVSSFHTLQLDLLQGKHTAISYRRETESQRLAG